MNTRTRSRPRSPFHGATTTQLGVLHAMATAVADWEHAAAAGNYYHLNPTPVNKQLTNLVFAIKLLEELESRALRRLYALPNSAAIREARRVEFMRVYDDKAYETYLLRQELAEVRKRTEALESAGV